MPVETTSLGSMRFYLGPPPSPSSPYPTPLTFENKINELGTVVIESVPSKVVAVRTFKGFVTQQESSRQLSALMADLGAAEGVELDVPHGERVPYIVSRFNPPYTVPVVRRNEIAVPVVIREGGGRGTNLTRTKYGNRLKYQAMWKVSGVWKGWRDGVGGGRQGTCGTKQCVK